MAAPTLQAEGTIAAVTSGSPAPTIPTHQADDILVARAVVWAPSTAGDAPQIPTPTGSVTYTLIGTQIGQPAGTRDGWLAWWWARADSAGETIAFTDFATAGWSGTATTCCYAAVVEVVRGAATSGDPWDAVAQGGPHTGANPAIPAVTVSGTERLILMMPNMQDNGGMGALTGWTASTNRTDTTGTDCAFKCWRKDNQSSSSGADVPTTVSAPAQGAIGYTGVSFFATVPVVGIPDLNMAPPRI